jgi:CheY-like chemotaxis protein
VTAERNALEDARRAHDHLEAIAAALPGVLAEYLVRPDGSDEFRYVSEPAREYFGVDPDEALRNSEYMWERVHPDDKAKAKTAILPSIEIVQAEAPPELAADLDDARTAARAASELVHQLMQLVRKDTRSGATTVDVTALVREVGQMCRRTFDPHIQIRSDFAPGPCPVLARRAELQQVLMNLCINARDALEGRSGAQLRLDAMQDADDVVVVVEDNGAGMLPDVQRRIGEPFFTTKPPGRGTGLGLATAFGIVSELRGSLTCQSTPGVGTRFELRLPRLHAGAGADMGHREPSVPSPRKMRVLLIDDEDLVRKTLERALQHEGAEVLSASGGAEGLSLLRAHPGLDLVLLDVAMPDIGGGEVLRRLREIDANVTVYLMTGFLPDGFEVAGASGVLSKPLELARLRAIVAEVARARSGATS